MNIVPGYMRVEHRRLEYDINRCVEAIRREKLPEEFAQLIRGLPLEEVVKAISRVQVPLPGRQGSLGPGRAAWAEP